MKKSVKLLAMLLALITVASTIPAFAAESKFEAPVEGYDNYGYYVYYDFEVDNQKVDDGTRTRLKTGEVKNALGLFCNPFGILSGSGGTKSDDASWMFEKEENGNTYLHRVQIANNDDDYDAVAVFQNKNGFALDEAVELSFKFRMNDTDTMGNKLQPMIRVRRGGYNKDTIYADESGKIYANLTAEGSPELVYTPSAEIIEKRKFIDVSFIWYDVTNTYSLFIEGDPILEGIRILTNLRSDDYVTKVIDDDFGVSHTLASTEIRMLEVFRRAGKADSFSYDIDDVKLSRVETAQKGAVYFESTFEGVANGFTQRVLESGNNKGTYDGGGTFYFSNNAKPTPETFKVVSEVVNGEENKYLSVNGGIITGFSDNQYQQLTQTSYVIEFSTNAKVVGNFDGLKSMVALCDHNSTNNYYILYADKNGGLYVENSESTLIGGYRLDGSQWLDITIVAVKNTTNAGKFGSFNSSTESSHVPQAYSFVIYINGEYVGATTYDFLEWRLDKVKKEDPTTYRYRTSANFEYAITDYVIGENGENAIELDTLKLVTDTPYLANGSIAAGHKIYKTSDGLKYYDVTFVDGEPTQYSIMALTDTRGIREDALHIFANGVYEGGLDNIRIYEGTAPEWYYETAASSEGGVIVDVDFAKASSSRKNITAQTTSKALSDQKGVLIVNGILGSKVVKKNASGETVAPADSRTAAYSTITFEPGNWLDFYVPPTPITDETDDFIMSFETKLRNLTLASGHETLPSMAVFFSQRFEDGIPTATDSRGYHPTDAMISVDAQYKLWAGNVADGSSRARLYNASGNQVIIDNSNWNTLRVDVHIEDGGNQVLLSYYLNGELLYLEDGSLAYRMNIEHITSIVETYYGLDNYRVRFTQTLGKNNETGDPGDTLDMDVEYITVSKIVNDRLYYDIVDDVESIRDGVSVISVDIPEYTNNEVGGYHALVRLLERYEDDINEISLIYAENFTGNLVACDSFGNAYVLRDKDGNIFRNAQRAEIVYDYALGTARYLVDGEFAYILRGGVLVPATDISVGGYSASDACIGEYLYVFTGYESDQNAVDTSEYAIEIESAGSADTALLVGLQENSLNGSIRLIAGVDNLYYSSIGFEVEIYENGVLKAQNKVSNRAVFESIMVGSNPLTAEEVDFKYLAAIKIVELPNELPENSYILVRSFAEIDTVVNYDEWFKIDVAGGKYSFDADFVYGATN